ncbi:MAG TPA: porin [Vicinamibacterales bacterium]|nr:porin [Vicinamibacterales bacterium]
MRLPSAAALVLPLLAASALSARAQEMRWNPRPSFRVGDALRLDVRVKIQADLQDFPSELGLDEDTFLWGRRRLGVEGTFLRDFEYRIERDFRGDGRWTDVFVNFGRLRALQIRAGRFKLPFSVEQITSAMSLDFAYRPAVIRDLVPGRDTGAMVHGRLFEDTLALGYQAGVFRHDGDNSIFGTNPGAGTTVAARATLRPFRTMPEAASLANLEAGAALVTGDVPDGPGPNSLRGRTIAGLPVLDRFYVNGRRSRFGAELNWEPGPAGLRAEFVRVWDGRIAQGPLGEDLPRLSAGGWYASGTWVVTGEQKAGGVMPRRPLFQGGYGALELAGRYERLQSGSDDGPGPTAPDPRSARVAERGLEAWTAGINWYLNRWAKIQLNAIRESYDDVERSPIPGKAGFWSAVCRFQFVL